jgi:hypothetical protein
MCLPSVLRSPILSVIVHACDKDKLEESKEIIAVSKQHPHLFLQEGPAVLAPRTSGKTGRTRSNFQVHMRVRFVLQLPLQDTGPALTCNRLPRRMTRNFLCLGDTLRQVKLSSSTSKDGLGNATARKSAPHTSRCFFHINTAMTCASSVTKELLSN